MFFLQPLHFVTHTLTNIYIYIYIYIMEVDEITKLKKIRSWRIELKEIQIT